MNNQKTIALTVMVLALTVLCSGCLSEATRRRLDEQQARAANINIIRELSSADALNWLEVGQYDCKEEDTHDCRGNLKFSAAGDNAELLVLNSVWSEPCPGNHEIKCERMSATGYVRKRSPGGQSPDEKQ